MIFSKAGSACRGKGLFGLAAAGKAKLKTKAMGTQSESEEVPTVCHTLSMCSSLPPSKEKGFKNHEISQGASHRDEPA